MNKTTSAHIYIIAAIFVVAAAVFAGPANIAHAQYYDTSWDTGSYPTYDTSWDTGGNYYDTSWDTGGTYYDTSWDTGSYPTYDTSWDTGGLYTGGNSTYGSGTLDNTYGSGSLDNTYGSGVVDNTYGSGTVDNTYGSGTVYSGGCSTCTYGQTDVYGHETTRVSGVGYSFAPTSYSAPVSAGKTFTFSAPSSYYKSTPPVYNPPVYNPPTYNPPTYNPPVVTTSNPKTTTTTTNNTCTDNSCNTSTVKTITNSYADNSYVDNSYVDNSIVDNSISGSYNTTVSNSGNTTTNVSTVKSISSAPVTHPVQYTYPTYTYPSYNPAPTCTISLSSGGSGGTATLTWYSSYATSAYIQPSIGRVASSGSMTVYPSRGTVYTMGVSGSGGSASCQTQSYYQPYVAASSVSLSQIPYTGFDLGPIGNALYWLSLLSFAVAGAYLLVYYRGGMLALASAFVARRNPRMAAVIESPTKAVQSAVAPIARTIDRVFASSAFSASTSATKRGMTTDTMMIERSNGKEAPRIVISRR